MKFAGHNNADTFFDSYAPELSTVDAMASYWNKKRRIIHLEGFRGLSLHHHPQLLQSLPAKVEANLESCADFVFINNEIEILGEKLRWITEEDEAQSARARREELYWRKRQLVSEELNKWQQIQPRKIASNTEDEAPQVASLPSCFNRIRRLDPPRDRLASSLFLNDPLRSVQGRSALQDMIALCEENPRVAYRPSLRPEDGHCPVPQCVREMDRFDYLSFLTSQTLGCCGLANQKFFNFTASMLPIDGNIFIVATRGTWNGNTALPSFVSRIINGPGWFEHCQRHLTDLETLPVQCNPLIFRRTLATAGQCLFCLFDARLSPTKRFHQFLIKQSWKEHLQEHFWQLEDTSRRSIKVGENIVVPCPDPRCALSFDSIQDLQCHCQDVHCVERIKLDPMKRRRRTYQSTLNVKVFPNASIKPKHHCDLLIEERPYKHVSESMDSSMLEPVDAIILTGPVELEKNYSLSQSYSLPLIDPTANQEKRSPFVPTFTRSENLLSITDSTSDETVLDSSTPASSVDSNLLLSIDPRLLNESDPLPIVRSQ